MSALKRCLSVDGRGVALLLGLALAGHAATGTQGRAAVSPWDAAVKARAAFEAAPRARHTRAEYARVMDKFRAVYHADPAAAHAPKAVEQVAELLAEEGREFDDTKALHDAAGQYEFLAKAYPGPALSPMALGQALDLLGPRGADNKAEARSVRAKLLAEYPKSSAAKAARESAAVAGAGHPASHLSDDRAVAKMGHPVAVADVKSVPARPSAAMPQAVVTGIRHWSTGTYTRVAIDLGPDAGDDVAYQAVRVVHPDRIFFDLQHVKLAPELAGKTFSVTDGGFLSSIRAAQMQDDRTRVVLDVQDVAEYSAFLLPNPERLIIDIHGRQEVGSSKQEVGKTAAVVSASSAPVESAVAAPVVRAGGGVEVSSLPPMPVTDGSAGFGLAPRSAATGSSTKTAVAQPRVVISTKPTVAKPVPNTVTNTTGQSGDVAAVSDQPGRVSATSRPTSLPVASGSGGDHYRSPRGSTADRLPATGSQLSATSSPVTVQPETAEGDATLMRALGLKIGRIVIDAGHGGHDVGTLGAGGIQEKDVVLDVALRLGKLLHDRLGAEIVYTRADDTFIPLETRTAIANKAQADLFISVHANSSPDASARGVEVYYLNFTSDPDAMKVASRENAVSTQSVHELSDLVKKIALKDKIDESRELAADVDTSLYAGLHKGNEGLKDRGVKKAPFVVLIGANMPSILAEISFVTNPDDADQLQTPAYRERVAESLYMGVAKYAAGINGQSAPVKKTKGQVTERAAR
jgi:N-acetylmuramoyl-L-alanine amidase